MTGDNHCCEYRESLYKEIQKETGTHWNHWNHGQGQVGFMPYWNLQQKTDHVENSLRHNIERASKEIKNMKIG